MRQGATNRTSHTDPHYAKQILLLEEIPPHAHAHDVRVRVKCSLEDLRRLVTANLFETRLDKVLPRIEERVLNEVQRSRLEWGFEGARDRREDDVPEEQPEESGDDPAFAMKPRIKHNRFRGQRDCKRRRKRMYPLQPSSS